MKTVDAAVLAREQAGKLADAAGVAAKKAAAEFQAKGMPMLKGYAQLIGIPTLAAFGALLLGWFVLDVVATAAIGGESIGMTFYGLMRVLHNSRGDMSWMFSGERGSAGIYGLITVLALLAPLVPHFLRHAKACYAYFAPLAWMAVTALIGYMKVRSAASESEQQATGGLREIMSEAEIREMQRAAREMVGSAVDGIADAFSLGVGFYVAVAAAVYLAYVGYKKVKVPVAVGHA